MHSPPTLQTFDFAPGVAVRSISKDSTPWFVAKDVCRALGFPIRASGTASFLRGLDDDEKDMAKVPTPGGSQTSTIINEAGLYRLVMRSNKPATKAFQKWVSGTVLPTLRRDGLYVAGQEKPITDALTLPDLLAQLEGIQTKVDALKASQVRAWSRHQEEKDARRDAFRFLKGKTATVRP
jgi:anti-repressor protein